MTIIRVGICVLITFGVLAHGAVETWSESIIEIGATALFLCWGFLAASGGIKEVRWTPVLWPLAGLEIIGLVQLAVPLSLNPYLTKLELLRLTSYLILLFLMTQAFRTPRQWRTFAWFLVLLGFSVAVFGILQDLTSNGKLYWVRELRYGGAIYGPYVNRNHFAGLMELIVPVGLSLLAVQGVRREQLPFLALCTALPIGALFMSASRGGIVAFGFEVMFLAALLWLRRGEKRYLLTFMVALALAGALVAWLGVGQVMHRISEMHGPEVSEGRRVSMMKSAWRIFEDYPILGTGLGTTVSVYPKYETEYDGKTVDHVHNDHFELLAETGIAGGLCWLAFVIALGTYGILNLSSRQDTLVHAVQLGALVACGGLLIHGLADFNLHIPANALLFYILAGMAASSPVFEPTN